MTELGQEIIQKIRDINNEGLFLKTNSIESDTKTLNAYSNYVSSKANERLLKTIKNYNRLMIGFGFLNLVLFFVNVWILAGKP